MVVIRLARGGAKSRPFYHILVTDSRSRRDGRFIERIGFFNPMAKGEEEYVRLTIERFDYWVGVGACVSDAVKRLIDVQRQAAESSSKKDKSAVVTKPLKARPKKSIKALQSEKALAENITDTKSEKATDAKPEKIQENLKTASEVVPPADKTDDVAEKEAVSAKTLEIKAPQKTPSDTVSEDKAMQAGSEEVLSDRDVSTAVDA